MYSIFPERILPVLEFLMGELRCGKQQNTEDTLKLIIHISEVKFTCFVSSVNVFAFVVDM